MCGWVGGWVGGGGGGVWVRVTLGHLARRLEAYRFTLAIRI